MIQLNAINMETKNTPPVADIQALSKQLNSILSILNSPIHRICIIADLDKGLREVLYFSSLPKTTFADAYKPLPPEFLKFVADYGNWLAAEKLKFDTDRPLVRFKSQVVYLDELIETLQDSATLLKIPQEQIDRLKDIQTGRSLSVIINNESVVIQRIS